jgi:predicted nucleic acid-binding protein
LKRVDNTIPCDEALGKRAGALRAAVDRGVRGPSGIDAIVAAVAATFRPSIVLTTDPDDLSALLALVPDVTVIAV